MANSKHPPNPDDVAIGARVRARRNQLGMSQGELGQALGITFQQIQKYEGGKNRIGGSRMLAIAKALDCPVASIFGAGDDPLGEISGFDRADLEFARAAARLPAKIKRKMLAIVSVVADAAAAGVKLPGLELVPMAGDDPRSEPGASFSRRRNGEARQ